jgi:hypothetical protein
MMLHEELLYSIMDFSRMQFTITGSIERLRFGDVFPAVLHGRDDEFDFMVVSDPIGMNTREDMHQFIVKPVDERAFWDRIKELDIEYTDYRHIRLDGRFILHELNNVLIVPRSAVNSLDDDSYVLLFEDGEIKARLVEVGFFDLNNIQIIAGLQEGQEILR